MGTPVTNPVRQCNFYFFFLLEPPRASAIIIKWKSCHSTLTGRTDYRGGGGKAVQPLGPGVLGQFSLAGNQGEAMHLASRVFPAGNHFNDDQRDKEQERAGEKRRRRLERSRGRRRREKFNEEHRKAERNRARDKTLHFFTMTAKFSRFYWLIFIVNKQRDTLS